MRRLSLLLTAAALTAGAVACGSEGAQAPADTPPGPPPVALISPEDLRAAVPQLTGWTRGDLTTQEGTTLDRSTHVLVTFLRGSEKLELEIADTGGDERAIEALEHMAGSDVNRTLDNGYFKGTMVATFPAVESWNTAESLGELNVLIRRRFVIHIAGSGLADAAPMRALAEAVDTSRLRGPNDGR